MRKMKWGKYKILSVLFCLFAVMLLLAGLSTFAVDKLTADTTTPFTATVRDITTTDTGEDLYVMIDTAEYRTAWAVPVSISAQIGVDAFSSLQSGDTIYFDVENIYLSQIDQVDFIGIVSLRTNSAVLFSMDDYNTSMHEAAQPVRIAGIAFSALLLCLALFFRKKSKQ